ncbi:hypothetical protein NKI54_03440 [Mesorhizobium sp. M0663]|uniref:hypothetical protein n=1 Tax=Mesorhizobium sp. M0663 TaxID=2956981 RepID=UPI0033377E59
MSCGPTQRLRRSSGWDWSGLDPIGLALETDSQGRAVGTSGRPTDSIFVSGPLARGSVGELMGIPEVTAHAERIAAEIDEWLGYQTALRHKVS